MNDTMARIWIVALRAASVATLYWFLYRVCAAIAADASPAEGDGHDYGSDSK